MINYYKILGISHNATLEEIKKAFRDKANLYHPDKNIKLEYSDAKFIELREAYEFISDKTKKAEYDAKYFAYFNSTEIEEKEIPDAHKYNNMGIAKGNIHDHQAAIKDFDKAIEIDSKYADAYYNRGVAKGALQDFQNAIKDFNKAVEIDSKYIEAYMQIGRKKGQLQDYKGAIIAFSKVIELNPYYTMAYLIRANAKGMIEDYQSAISDYNKAIDMVPNDANAYYFRGCVKLKIKQQNSGWLDLRKAAELGDISAKELLRKYRK